jgi:hypothetical protein
LRTSVDGTHRVVRLEDALAQLHTDHVPMAGVILQFRRRTG